MDSGVPQGSVLGPGLFLYYINDLQSRLTSIVRLFADDTIAYLTISNNNDAETLQNDLDKLGHWENEWCMKFHPDKCTVLRVTNKKKITDAKYQLHGHTLRSFCRVSASLFLDIVRYAIVSSANSLTVDVSLDWRSFM
jgi:hypothetical protein